MRDLALPALEEHWVLRAGRDSTRLCWESKDWHTAVFLWVS